MKICPGCNAKVPHSTVIDGRRRNLDKRKYCFSCSPWKSHNTRKRVPVTNADGRKKCAFCQTALEGNQTKFCSNPCRSSYYYNAESPIYIAKRAKMVRTKYDLIQDFGGKCSACGYNKNISSLSFHHIDPTTKKFEINVTVILGMRLEKIKEEASKCSLLCLNCHNELHYPNSDMRLLTAKFESEQKAGSEV